MNEKIQDAIDQKLAQESFDYSVKELKQSLAVGRSDTSALYTIDGLIELTKHEAENPRRSHYSHDLDKAIENGLETQECLNDFLSVMGQNNIKPDEARQFIFDEEKTNWLGTRTISRVRNMRGWIVDYGSDDGYLKGFFVTTSGLVESSGLDGTYVFSSHWRPGHTNIDILAKSLADKMMSVGITKL